jgi:hypothetical protein
MVTGKGFAVLAHGKDPCWSRARDRVKRVVEGTGLDIAEEVG